MCHRCGLTGHRKFECHVPYWNDEKYRKQNLEKLKKYEANTMLKGEITFNVTIDQETVSFVSV